MWDTIALCRSVVCLIFFSKKHDMILQESNTYSLIYREPKEFDEKKLLS